MELHERIKKARTELHLSQEYVANYLGVKRTAIVEIELSPLNYFKILKFFYLNYNSNNKKIY